MCGSFTVLEHVSNPVQLLREMVRVAKPNGLIIVAGPSFLRVVGLSAFHPRTRGFINPIKNTFLLLGKYFLAIVNPKKLKFRFMKPILGDNFATDYDAICETNMVDVRAFLKMMDVSITYQSGLVNIPNKPLINPISLIPIVRDMTGGYFITGIKSEEKISD